MVLIAHACIVHSCGFVSFRIDRLFVRARAVADLGYGAYFAVTDMVVAWLCLHLHLFVAGPWCVFAGMPAWHEAARAA